MKEYQFEATVKASEIGQGGAYVEFPYDVHKEFGIKGRVKVVCYFDGVEYRGSLAKMGTECHIVGISKEIRKKIGKDIGDTVAILLCQDESERTVGIHPLLNKELEHDAALRANYEKLSYTKKKEIANLLTSVKKQETLQNRLNDVLANLKKE